MIFTLILSLQGATCAPPVASELRPSRDLYCIDLTATERGGAASGTVALEYIPGPFTVPLTSDGHYRYAPLITLRRLPRPPAGTSFVAWAATPTLDVIRPLGKVTNGDNHVREITLDRFLVLISAETAVSSEPRGPILLRGESPSNRMRPPDLYQLSLGAVMPPAESSGWHGVPMTPNIPMLPSEMALTPAAAPWVPRASGPVAAAQSPQLPPRALHDGDTLELVAGPVHRSVAGHDVLMYGFDGEQPGPLLVTTQGARITVRLTNHLDQPTSVHWHGVRLDNRFDGVPGVTQPVVPPGGTFIYTVRFPDAGIYWYHPHQREDIQQDLGLYGNILVRPAGDDLYGPANREETLILDDLLIGDDGPVAYGSDTPTHALMGRFGNVMLVNGQPAPWSARAHRGDVIRFYLTNAANTRTFNVSFQGAGTKLAGTDLGPFERAVWTSSVVIGPGERYVMDVRFARPGRYALVNRVRVLDRLFGHFVPETDTLGVIAVDADRADPDLAGRFDSLAVNRSVQQDIARYGRDLDRPPDRQLLLTMHTHGLPFLSERLMMLDSAWFAPVEWGAAMPAMNWSTTGKEVRWVLRDPATGRENMDIGWHFRRGDVIKLRIANDRTVLHGMQHPIHLHGQRFLVLAVNGERNDNLAWKDTVLVPSGATVDLLVDLSNPGTWMLHCHIAEHLEAGMMTTITVD